jgi:hypothetical protein
MSTYSSRVNQARFRPLRALAESAIGIVITFVLFSEITVLIVLLGLMGAVIATPAHDDRSGFFAGFALYAVPTVAIGLVVVVVVGLPTSYLLGWLTRGLRGPAMIAIHFGAALVLAGVICGLLLVAVSPAQDLGFGLVTSGIAFGIVPGISAATGAGFARLLLRPTTRSLL